MSEHEASNAPTSTERLEERNTNPALRIIMARDPAAPAHLLETLAKDQDVHVRQAVADNPNTSWKTLEHLAVEFPHVFLHNHAGLLQIMAFPEQIRTDGIFWDGLLHEATIPSWWWIWLLSHPILHRRDAVRFHVQSAGEATHPYGVPKVGEEHDLLALVELLSVVCEQGIPLPVLMDSPQLHQSMLSGERIVVKHLQWLARRTGSGLKQAVAKNRQTPVEVLAILARDRNTKVRAAVASHPQTPIAVLTILAQDKKADVRVAVASHPQTPVEVLAVLARDEKREVRAAVASHPQAPGDSLHFLAQDAHTQIAVARHPKASVEILCVLAQTASWVVREVVAGRPQTPGEVLRELAKDERSEVREAIARNSQTPGEVLAVLAQDKTIPVWEAVAGNVRTPVEVWQILAQDQTRGEGNTRRKQVTVPERAQTLEEVLLMLAQDPRWWVPRTVASHPQAPREALNILARSPHWEVRMRVVRNHQTPGEILRFLSQDQESTLRAAVASHPQTPREVLCLLSQDQEASVRGAVATNPLTSRKILHALSHDEVADVRWVASLVQRLRAQSKNLLEHEQWWTQFRGVAQVRTRPLKEQLDWVSQLHASATVSQIILDALCTDWDATSVQRAFVVSETHPALILQARRKLYERILTPFLPPVALQKLAEAPFWEIRYLVALNAQTPRETRLHLCQDGNRYVRAMARAKVAQMGKEGR
jgi:hypothetical protein